MYILHVYIHVMVDKQLFLFCEVACYSLCNICEVGIRNDCVVANVKISFDESTCIDFMIIGVLCLNMTLKILFIVGFTVDAYILLQVIFKMISISLTHENVVILLYDTTES